MHTKICEKQIINMLHLRERRSNTLNACMPISEQFIQRYPAVGTFSVRGVKENPLLLPIFILLKPVRALEAILYDFPTKLLHIVRER